MTDQALRPELSQGRDYSESAFFNIFKEIPAGNLPGVAAAGATPFGETLPYLSSRLKRTLDILLVLCAAPLTVVLVGLAALAIKLNSRGPVFFVQERLGRNGVPFPCYKLRTMVVGAEQGTPQWAADNDPRVTRVGRFLRQTRLDELPQLYNIWRGEMSFVGVRPIRQHFAAMLAEQAPLYQVRFLTKPGLTGWDQVHNGYPSTLEAQLRKFSFDLYYLKNASFWLDLLVLGKTVKVILRCKGH
jgi:lipopolysaccharide/colanic/teichoic acid biosynthesis glycosyltransferase